MTIREAYMYMLGILSCYYEITRDDELGEVLGGIDLYSDSRPADPAAWTDWEEAVSAISNKPSIDETTTLLATKSLLELYNRQGFDLQKIINFIDGMSNRYMKEAATWIKKPETK
jgi:hypothetical protein